MAEVAGGGGGGGGGEGGEGGMAWVAKVADQAPLDDNGDAARFPFALCATTPTARSPYTDRPGTELLTVRQRPDSTRRLITASLPPHYRLITTSLPCDSAPTRHGEVRFSRSEWPS